MLAGEPATWLGASPDPDSLDWEWKPWFGPVRPFAVDTGADYLAALETTTGQTAGKRLLGLRVTGAGANRPSAAANRHTAAPRRLAAASVPDRVHHSAGYGRPAA